MKKLLCLSLSLLLLCSVYLPATADEQEYRTWLQSDPRWGSISFGTSDTIAKSGCALTSIAKLMVHSGAASADSTVFNPGIFCNWLKQNGGLTSQGWIVWSAAANYSKTFSYHNAIALSGTKEQKTAIIKSYLDDGYVLVASVKYGGHYVAVDKVANNTVYIMDSASNGYTKLFSYDNAGIDKIQIYKGPHGGNQGGSTPTPTPTPTYDTTIDPLGAGEYIITSDNGINLRSGAGTSYNVLTAIPYNETVKVTKVKNGWGYTTYNGQSGWFTLEFAKLTVNSVRGLKVTPPTKTTYELGEKLSTSGMKVTALYINGDERTVSSTKYTVSGFSSEKAGSCKVYVTFSKKSAVFTVTINPKTVTYQTGKYTISDPVGVNLRSTYSTSGTILEKIPCGETLTVTKVQDNWGKTTYNGTTGWFCLDYTDYISPTQTGITVTANISSVNQGDLVKRSHFTVKRVYDDGTTQTITDFTFSLGKVTNGLLPITVTDGSFSATVKVTYVPKLLMGDCNSDKKIDAADALMVLQAAVGKPSANFVKEAADLNGDQKIDAADALMILQIAVGKATATNLS